MILGLLLSLFFNPSVFLTPTPCGHYPYNLLCKTQGESVIPGLLLLMFFQPLCFFNPSVLRPPPLYLLRKTQGRSVIHVFLYSSMCFLYNNIKHSHLLPLYCCVTRQRESVRFDFVTVAVFSTPPSFGHLPYILLCKTQGRRGRSIEC